MAGSIGGEKRIALQTDMRVLFRVRYTTYLLKAVTGFGYLALTWSTVVLLGGFVTVLQKKDFWCLTVISMTQATRIFNDFAERLVHNFVIMLAGNIRGLASQEFRTFWGVVGAMRRTPAAVSNKWCWVLWHLYVGTIVLPLQAICCVTLYLYRYSGPVVCIVLALWRIAQRDYGGDASSNGNLMPALDLFYSLVLLQGVLYVMWAFVSLVFNFSAVSLIRDYREQLCLPDQQCCRRYVFRYMSDTRARCWRQPESIRGRRLLHFAVESLDSGSWKQMLLGVRLLDAYVMQGEDIRRQLLPSRPRIQKLIDALGWRHPVGAREMREPAARIVAHLAGDIHLAQFPGVMECISSLLHQEETTTWPTKEKGDGGTHGDPNELILQGLAILEGLAFDDHNCRCMCSSPGLLRKVMAPLSSANLINDISNRDWAGVVSGSIKVLLMLVQGAGKASRRLRREMYYNKQIMSSLQGILQHFNEASSFLIELQVGAMGILTQLALDLSINLAIEIKENLIKKQLSIFLVHREEDELKPLKTMAGRTLVLLSTKIESYSALIMTIENDTMHQLSVILDAKNTAYRTIAAQILENLCAHCDLDKQWIKEALLPKVLAEILSSKRVVAPENGVSLPRDEENQQNSAPGNHEENHNNYTQKDDTEIQETSSTAEQNKSSDGGNKEETTTSKLMREAFLSLALVIRNKLISADDFDDAVKKVGVGPAVFVTKIKAIVEDNCQETAESLRIVKLCCRIVEPMMQRDQYAQHFINKAFVVSVSEASRIMSKLESCMLFAGTDFGLKNTTRPLLSDLKN